MLMPENLRPDPKEMVDFKAGLLGQLQDLFEQITDKEEKRLAEACIQHLTNESEEDNAED